jgi:hypothetical protein
MSYELEGAELIGEALRGMQSTEVGAALAQLQNVMAAKQSPHAQNMARSLQRPISTQMGILCTGTFTPAAWTGSSVLPTVSGKSRVYRSFVPAKAVNSEKLLVTFTNSSLGATTVAVSVPNGDDLVLIGGFSGAENVFPNAPDQTSGISGSSLAPNALGQGISWPVIRAGIDATVTYAIEQTAVFQAVPPAGYTTAQITSITIIARLNLFGPATRY